MIRHSITALKDFDVAPDGRKLVLNFEDASGFPISLEVSDLALEKIYFELGFAITKAHQLSELPKQQIVSFLRPTQFGANLASGEQTVVITFRQQNGLDVHYGLEPKGAELLARQMLAASEHGKSAKKPAQN